MLSLGAICRFRPGELLLREGEPSGHVMLIANGRVKVTSTAENGYAIVLIRAPCRTINEVWSGAAGPDALKLAVNGRIDAQRMAIERRLRIISRRFAPEATADLEQTLNTALGSPSSLPGDPDLTCGYSVHVAPDSELYQYLRKAEIKRLEDQSDHVRQSQRLADLELMRGRWLAFLRQFDGDELGTLAAQLADGPGQLADLIAKRASERERDRDDLRKLFDTTSEAYRNRDVFDFVISADSALSRLLRHVGIDSVPGTEHRPASSPNESENGASPAHGVSHGEQ